MGTESRMIVESLTLLAAGMTKIATLNPANSKLDISYVGLTWDGRAAESPKQVPRLALFHATVVPESALSFPKPLPSL